MVQKEVIDVGRLTSKLEKEDGLHLNRLGVISPNL